MTTKTLHPKAPRARSEQVRVGDIDVDPAYQRSINRAAVKRMADNFDPGRLGTIHVSRRLDGSLWAVDGQHRLAVLVAVGWVDRKIRCEVYDGLAPSDEANLFVGLNNSVKVRAVDNFLARIAANETAAVRISNVCNKHGFTVYKAGGDGLITCVVALEKVYKGHGLRGDGSVDHLAELDTTLDIITSAWGTSADVVNGSIVEGIGQVVLRNGKAIDKAHMVKVLAGHPGGPVNLLGKARGLREANGGSVAYGVADYVVRLYNKGRRVNKLPEMRRS